MPASRMDFPSGLVTVESGMIALIDLSHILPASIGEGARNAKLDGTPTAANPAIGRVV